MKNVGDLMALKPEKESECSHLYFPVCGSDGKYTGQECALCGKFNSLKDLGMEKKS